MAPSLARYTLLKHSERNAMTDKRIAQQLHATVDSICHQDYAIFLDYGYRGLYGGLAAKDIHTRKGLKKSQKILDHRGSTELAANLFRATQTEEKLKRDQVQGKRLANQTHFEADSDFSWTVDFTARRAKAQADMLPFLEEVKNLTEALLPLKEDLKALKKDKASKEKISVIEEAIKAKEKAIREAHTKAVDIDAAVYDLKAVNPNVKAMSDTRTVLEIIENINLQGQVVATAMNKLRCILGNG